MNKTVEQIRDYFNSNPETPTKMTILENCATHTMGCEQTDDNSFAEFKKKYGIKTAESTTVIF